MSTGNRRVPCTECPHGASAAVGCWRRVVRRGDKRRQSTGRDVPPSHAPRASSPDDGARARRAPSEPRGCWRDRCTGPRASGEGRRGGPAAERGAVGCTLCVRADRRKGRGDARSACRQTRAGSGERRSRPCAARSPAYEQARLPWPSHRRSPAKQPGAERREHGRARRPAGGQAHRWSGRILAARERRATPSGRDERTGPASPDPSAPQMHPRAGADRECQGHSASTADRGLGRRAARAPAPGARIRRARREQVHRRAVRPSRTLPARSRRASPARGRGPRSRTGAA